MAEGSIENLQILLPAQNNISLEPNERDRRFLKQCKYFNDGSYSRPNVFVCELPEAFCHVCTGLVCDRGFRAISDSQMGYRLGCNPAFKGFKPTGITNLRGTYSTIQNVYWDYWWHWLVDCLPRLLLLEEACPGRRVILLVPENLAGAFEESLGCLCPPNFEIRRLPPNAWVKVDRLILPTYVSGRGNGHIPAKYCQSIRRKVFAKLGLAQSNNPVDHIYVSRAHARYRRILNEGDLMGLLRRYGFKSVAPERLTFGEQVALFHRAAVVVSAYGSNWTNILFSGNIKILVLYPDRQPETHVFTMAKALGQEHFFLAGVEGSVDSDFSVDLSDVENVLRNEMDLRPVG